MKKLHLLMSDSQGKEEAQREEDHLTPPTQEAVGAVKAGITAVALSPLLRRSSAL